MVKYINYTELQNLKSLIASKSSNSSPSFKNGINVDGSITINYGSLITNYINLQDDDKKHNIFLGKNSLFSLKV